MEGWCKSLMVSNKISFYKLNLENIYLILIFSILLWAGCATLFDYRIVHEFPYGYLASDAFQHQTRAESIKDAGNYREEAFYIVAGNKGVIGYYPPLIYHISALFSLLTGIEVYDAIYFLIFIFGCLAPIIIYFIINHLNKHIAILSLPLSILIFSRAPYIGFTWGHWPSIIGQFFLIATVWSLIKKPKIFLLTILLIGTCFSHTSELIILLLFIFFLVTIKKINFKTIFITLLLFFIISSYYLIIFKFTWMHTQPYRFNILKDWGGSPIFKLSDFKFISPFIILGMFLSLFAIKSLPILFSFFMFIIGYGNYYGFNFRAFQIRFFWPLYLSPFFGIALYRILKLIIKKIKLIITIALAIIILVLLLKTSYTRISYPGLMDKEHWQLLTWLKENTPEDAEIYFFYGDIYDQDALLRNVKRKHYLVATTDYIQAIKSRIIKSAYLTETPSDAGTHFPVRKGLFNYKYLHSANYTRIMPICDKDYYVIDKVSRFKPFAQYNLLLLQSLLKNSWIKKVFENHASIVLMNTNTTKECIPKEGIKIG